MRRKLGLWRWSMRRRLAFRLRPPVTLNEKIQYKMACDRRPLLTMFADKWGVRPYVAGKVGKDALNEVYQLIADPADLDVSSLPERCVIKPTHGSGSVIVVDERASRRSLPDLDMSAAWLFVKCRIRREDLDEDRLRRIVKHWLDARYPLTTEWAYHDIPANVVVERYIEGEGEALPSDYKFFVMHGKVAFVQVDVARFEGHRRQLFDPTWAPIAVDYNYPRPDTLPERPECLDQMMEMAAILGADTDFVRVDLYEEDGRVRFGELTNYPEAGQGSFSDAGIAATLAGPWNVPRSYASGSSALNDQLSAEQGSRLPQT